MGSIKFAEVPNTPVTMDSHSLGHLFHNAGGFISLYKTISPTSTVLSSHHGTVLSSHPVNLRLLGLLHLAPLSLNSGPLLLLNLIILF